MYRTKTCGELNLSNVNEEVELSGWIQKIRNLGGMIFIDLRDEFGITQIVINDEKLEEQIKSYNTESCIHINGQVVERSSKNSKIPTGEIEIVASKIEVLGKCKGTTKLKRKRLFSCNAAFPNNRIGLRNKPTDLSVRSRHAESTDSNIDRANIARIRTVRFIRSRHHMHGNNRFVALSNAFERKKWHDGRIDVVPSHRNHALFRSIGLINANNLSGIANADVQIPSKRIGKSH